MPRAVCGGRPGGIAGVIHFDQDGPLPVTESDRAGAIRELLRKPAQHIGDAIHGSDVRRRRCHDEVTQRGEGGIGRKSEIDLAREPEATDIFEVRVRVVDLDVLEVRPSARLVGDT